MTEHLHLSRGSQPSRAWAQPRDGARRVALGQTRALGSGRNFEGRRNCRRGQIALLLLASIAPALAGGCKKPFSGAEIIAELHDDANPDQTMALLRHRLADRGLSGLSIMKRKPSIYERKTFIVIRIPNIEDEERMRITALLQKKPRIGFHWVAAPSPQMAALVDRVENVDRARAAELGIWVEENTLWAKHRRERITIDEAKARGCYHEYMAEWDGKVDCKVLGRTVLERYAASVAKVDPEVALPPNQMFRCNYQHRPDGSAWYALPLHREPAIDGYLVKWARIEFVGEMPVVAATLRPGAGRRLANAAPAKPGLFAIMFNDGIAEAFVYGGEEDELVLRMASPDKLKAYRQATDLVDVLRWGIPLHLDITASRTIVD